MVIFQKPNKELIVTISAWMVVVFTRGILHAIAASIGFAGGIIWSYMELTSGVNWFRKLLGAFVLCYFLYTLCQSLLK